MSVMDFLIRKGYSGISLLARGSYGKVYRAFTPENRLVAIKVLHPRTPKDRELAESEIQILLHLQQDHHCRRHILCLLDYSIMENTIIIITEYIRGMTLRDVIWLNTVSNWIPLFRQLAEVVQIIHQQGIVHRDLKDDNIMLSEGEIIILDFGISCSVFPITGVIPCYQYPIRGSIAYSAPEVLTAGNEPNGGGSEIDYFAADVYSLGVIFYYALSRHLPFSVNAPSEYIQKTLHDPPLPLPVEIPENLRSLVMQMLSKNPSERSILGTIIQILS